MLTSNASSNFSKITLDGEEYTITKLMGMQGFKGWTLIQKTLAPVMGKLFDSKNVSEEMAMFENQNVFEGILSVVADNFDSPEFDDLIDRMLTGTLQSDGTPADLNALFQGKPELMMQLIVFALQENFSGFFTGNSMYMSLFGKMKNLTALTEM